jgi:hypothetical protein
VFLSFGVFSLSNTGPMLNRTIHNAQIGPDMVVIDACQKKSKSGIKTPQADVDRIKQRIKGLKEHPWWRKMTWHRCAAAVTCFATSGERMRTWSQARAILAGRIIDVLDTRKMSARAAES